jgi:hypothetical protein
VRVLAFSLGALLCAQTPGPDQLARTTKPERLILAKQWIQDSRPLYKAWAAELIRSDHIESLTPQLVVALGDADQPAVGLESEARLAVLDGLVEIGAEVPALTLRAFFSTYPAQVLLLANRPGTWSTTLMFDLLARANSDESWLAIGNRLTTGNNPGVAAWLLRDLRVTATIEVEDTSRRVPGGFAGGVIGGVIGSVPTAASQAIWPPLRDYQLTLRPCDGCALFADGPHPVYYLCGGSWQAPEIKKDRNVYLHEYLARLLSIQPERLPVLLQPKLIHKWTAPENYRVAGSAFLAEQEKSYREVAKQLFQLRYLTKDEWYNARLSLAVKVHDFRAVPRAPLPELSK